MRPTYLCFLLLLACLPLKAEPTKTAVLISVGHYANPALPPTSAVRDADSITQSMYKQGYTRIYRLSDTSATKAKIESLIKGLGVTTYLTVLVMGQGTRIGKEAVFLPYDAVLNDFSTMLPISQIGQQLWACGAKVTLIFTDICRLYIAPPANIGSIGAWNLPTEKGRHFGLIESCGPGEFSPENASGHGICTWFFGQLLDDPKLQQIADTDHNKQLSLQETFSFLSQFARTSIKTEDSFGLPPKPIFRYTGDRRVVFMPVQNTLISAPKRPAQLPPPVIKKLGHRYLSKTWQPSMPGRLRTKPRWFHRFLQRNGVLHDLDLADYFSDPTKLVLVFPFDPNNQWSRRMHWELSHNPVLKPFFSDGGPYRLIIYSQDTPIYLLENEFLDVSSFKNGCEDALYKWLRKGLQTGAIACPAIIVLGADDQNFYRLLHYHPGYQLPGELASSLRQLLAYTRK